MTAQKEGEEQGKLQAGRRSHCRVQEHLEAVLDQSFPVIVQRSCSVGWAQHPESTCTWGFPVAPFLWPTGPLSQDGPATELLIFLLHILTSWPFSEPNRDCVGSWA